jgi:hypothetical protein
MLSKWHTKSDLCFYFVAFILGPIAEVAAIYSGTWTYSKSFFLIPIWLPFGWGIASLIIKKISETLVEKK